MHKILLSTWPLFFGVSMLMVGNGLQNTLLGVRAAMEDFDTEAIGLIMSSYYIGFLLGARLIPSLVIQVGHIRVFAALASLASVTVLFHALFPDPYVWFAVRVVTGFSFVGLFIVIESWLNNIATNQSRGRIMALYLIVLYTSMVAGQFLLGAANPGGMELFILISILISVAILPISLSSRPAPKLVNPERVSIKDLYKTSPLGVVGVFLSGMGSSMLFTMGPVYAEHIGLSLTQISSFMAIFIAGGVLFQSPIGWLSDKYDRRKILIGVTFIAALMCGAAYITVGQSFTALLVAMFFMGSMMLSVYALTMAHTNDHLGSGQIVAAGATMIMINGTGACIGPIAISFLIDHFGTQLYYPVVGMIFMSISLFGVYRTFRRAPVPADQRGDFVPVSDRASPIIMQVAHEAGNTMKKMND